MITWTGLGLLLLFLWTCDSMMANSVGLQKKYLARLHLLSQNPEHAQWQDFVYSIKMYCTSCLFLLEFLKNLLNPYTCFTMYTMNFSFRIFVMHLVLMLNCPLNTYFEVHEWCCSYVHFNKIVLKEQNWNVYYRIMGS